MEEHGGAPLPGTFESFFYLYIWVLFFLYPEDIANLICGNEEKISVHMLCECVALASLRLAYLCSFFLGHENVTNLSLGAIWNFGKGTGLL